jgi:hypothetical protein
MINRFIARRTPHDPHQNRDLTPSSIKRAAINAEVGVDPLRVLRVEEADLEQRARALSIQALGASTLARSRIGGRSSAAAPGAPRAKIAIACASSSSDGDPTSGSAERPQRYDLHREAASSRLNTSARVWP